MKTVATRYGEIRTFGPDDMISRFLERYGEWALDEAFFLSGLVPDGAKVADIGAYLGTFGLGLGLFRRLGHVCFVEPNAQALPLLEANVAANATAPFTIAAAAVAPEAFQPAQPTVESGNAGSLSFACDGGSASDREAIPDALNQGGQFVTLAALRERHGPFDLVKIDVEGMELDVLGSDAHWLGTNDATIWLECNEGDPRAFDVLAFLLGAGFAVHYFAFPAHNPENIRGDPEPIFPFAFEAGLLARRTPETPPLNPQLAAHGCILTQIASAEDLRRALGDTPRWGQAEWLGLDVNQLVARVGPEIQELRSRIEALEAGTDAPSIDRPAESLSANARLEELASAKAAAEELAIERLAQLEAANARLEALKREKRGAEELAERRLVRMESAARVSARAARRCPRRMAARLWRLLTRRRTTTEKILMALIDRQAYLEANPDVPAGESDPVRHFLRQGWQQGRALAPRRGGTPEGDRELACEGALNSEPMVRDSAVRAAVAPYFDPAFYLAENADVAAAGVDPLDHFLGQGWREGRNPSAGFDTGYYLTANPDVAAASMNPLYHYALSGRLEGRRPVRENAELRALIERARPLRELAPNWRALEAPSAEPCLARLLAEAPGRKGLVISVSHDSYTEIAGGVQSCIGDEQARFAALGQTYLHLCPAAPLPLLSDETDPERFRFLLTLDGRRIGIASAAALGPVLREASGFTCDGARALIVVHHLLGHSPEIIVDLTRSLGTGPGETLFWAHDLFSLCPNFPLLRNGAVFCGGPPSESPSCGICVHGEERATHLARLAALFGELRPRVLAPSESALSFWTERARVLGLVHGRAEVIAHARLELDAIRPSPSSRPLRVAFSGAPAPHKGWPAFERLVARMQGRQGAGRCEFLHFGTPDTGLPGVRHVEVQVSREQRDAMIDALRREEVDVVVNWSLCYETFSFTAHEAMAAGCWLIAREGSGAIAALIRNTGQGIVLEDDTSLFELFETGRMIALIEAARARGLRAGRLVHGGVTADALAESMDADNHVTRGAGVAAASTGSAGA